MDEDDILEIQAMINDLESLIDGKDPKTDDLAAMLTPIMYLLDGMIH